MHGKNRQSFSFVARQSRFGFAPFGGQSAAPADLRGPRTVDAPVVTTEELLAVLREMVPMERVQAFEQTAIWTSPMKFRGWRATVPTFSGRTGGISAVFREIPQRISTVEELGLPIMLRELALLPKGLVLVTGPTGSGKSTTLGRAWWTTPIPSAATISLPLKTPSNSCINPRAAS